MNGGVFKTLAALNFPTRNTTHFGLVSDKEQKHYYNLPNIYKTLLDLVLTFHFCFVFNSHIL
jgi:hypothetical protein